MKNHLQVNGSDSDSGHLFSYRREDGSWTHLTKKVFLARCYGIWEEHRLLKVNGHSFRIGGATELLAGGMPPAVVASIGRWKSLSFLLYWRRNSEIISNSFSSSYDSSRIKAISASMDAFRVSENIPMSIVDACGQ